MVGDYAAIADTYANERPDYLDLAELIGEGVRNALKARGMETVVVWRAKETLSLVKKALRKGYANPIAETDDKAGIRVIVHYLDDVLIVEETIQALCDVYSREEKCDALAYNQLGYLGVHLQVQPKPEFAAQSANPRVAKLQAELQIHTKAQSAWAVVSHDILYKAPLDLPNALKRDITRLVALVELFDAEVRRFTKTMEEEPAFKEMRLVGPLDDLMIQYTAQSYDRALSALSVPPLVRLYQSDPGQIISDKIKPFLLANASKLAALYDHYRDDYRANPLLLQPEALLIFERLDNDPDRLVEAWPANVLPIELLDELANIWGADIEVVDH